MGPGSSDDSEGKETSGQADSKSRRPKSRHRQTDRARVQDKEQVDLEPLHKMPPKPMMELQAGSNIWYQAYVIKESENEAKVCFPGGCQLHGLGWAWPTSCRCAGLQSFCGFSPVSLRLLMGWRLTMSWYAAQLSMVCYCVAYAAVDEKQDHVEWVKKSSSRIWRGSYRNGDWRHLGKGAWAPRERPRRNRSARTKVRPRRARHHKKRRRKLSGMWWCAVSAASCDVGWTGC